MDIYADLPEKPTKDAAISLANHLLQEFRIPTRIVEPEDISSSLFVVLYESLFSDRLPAVIRQPVSKDDEIHNCQIVIDVLSNDVIHDSLSHIRAVDIVAGDLTAIFNLLDIFSHLLEYVINRIESDHEDSRSVGSVETGAKTSQLPKKNIPLGLKKSPHKKDAKTQPRRSSKEERVTYGSQRAASLNKNENRKAYDDHRVISHEDFYAMTYGGLSTHRAIQPLSPIRYDHSQSLLGQKTVDSEFDAGTEKVDKVFDPVSHHPKIAWDVSPPTSSGGQCVNDAAVTTTSSLGKDKPHTTAAAAATTTDDHYPAPFSASMPPPSRPAADEKQEPLRSTVGSFYNQTYSKEEDARADRAPVSKNLPCYYDNLKHLVKKTAAMTRIALSTSSFQKNAEKDSDMNEPSPSLSSEGIRLAQELNAVRMSPTSGGCRLAQETNAAKMSPSHGGGRLAQGSNPVMMSPSSRSVTLAQEPSAVRTSPSSRSVRLAQEPSAVRMSPSKTDQYPGGKKKVAFITSQTETQVSSGDVPGSEYREQWVSDESDQDVDTVCPGQGFRRRYKTSSKVNAGLPADLVHQKPKSSTSAHGNKTFARHLVLNRQPELGAAHMALKNEDLAIRKKQEMLRKFYEKDHEEFKEDVEYMLGRDLEKAAETEEQYLQRCAEAAVKKKGVQKMKGTSLKPARKKLKMKSARRRIPGEDHKIFSPPLELKHEEDLLPFLMDEFPYLHLTEHTWHELWRKGLHQIEALTRAYQEIERKKSRAQNQLAEAAERHSLLSEIMRKQLDHSRRMQEIQEQKQQQIHMRNKNHEKRIQSARARRYYNEFQVRARAKVLKKRTKEELIFRDLFKDTLNIQRERIKDIRRYASDQRQRQEQQRQNEIDSLENYYQTQFELLAERLARERFETEVRDVAQKQMMDRMKKELQKKMESEIKQYQAQMFRDEDSTVFRQADADRLKQFFHLARYSVKI